MTEIATFAAYVIFIFAPLTQAFKILKTKMSDEIALAWPLMLIAAMCLIVPGMVETGKPILIIGHLITLLANLINLGAILWFRRRQPSG